MDGIVVGRGKAGDQMLIPTGETRTLEASTYVDSSRLDEWLVTHLRNDETTRLSVSFDTTIKLRGVKRQFPLEFISCNRTFSIDVFGPDMSSEQSGSQSATTHLLSEHEADTISPERRTVVTERSP